MPRQPHWFRTWTESPLRVVSQRSNQLVQRVRPAGEKLAGRLDCHISLSLTASDVGMKSMAGGSIRSTCQQVNCANWFLKLSARLVTVLLNNWCEVQKHPVNYCMIITHNAVYCVRRRIWQFLLLIHHDVSSDRAWLPYGEPCMSCQHGESFLLKYNDRE